MHRSGEFDLTRLLGSVEPATFFRDWWEQQPLAVSRCEGEFYRELFTRRDVDSVIAFTRPVFPDASELKPGGTPHYYVRGMLAESELPSGICTELPELHRAFAHGKTLIINALERRWPAVATMCHNLQAEFGCRVHTNLYLTPPGAQGFGAHYDPDETFVLQIDGCKQWRFYGPARELPLLEEKVPVRPEQLAKPTLEVFLQPGDLLYLPRGHVHEAFTTDKSSLHLTVAVRVYRWVELLQRALARAAANNVRFRQSLPPRLLIAEQTPPDIAGQFRELLQNFAASADLEGALSGMADAFVSKLAPLPQGYFADDHAQAIDLDTPLERAVGVICRVVENADNAILQAPGIHIDGPASIAPALRFIARTPRFTPRELPGELTPEAKLALARRLIRERLLTGVSE